MSTRAVRAHHEGLAAVAHELRLPLSHIKGFVTSLRRVDVEWDEETRSEFLAEIDLETDRLAQLVESLLVSSAPDRSIARAPNLVFTDPASVVEGALHRIRGLLGERSLRRKIPPSLPAVRMDASQMERVLANLLQNAIKYSPPGSPIGVSARSTRRGELEFTIDDQGSGVPVADRARIFEPLFRKQAVETVERAWSRHWAGKSASPSFSRTAATCGSVSAVVAVRGSAFPPGANALRPGRARERWTG